MKHPSEATLALHAGNDLGLLARWRLERHLAGCDACRDEVQSFVSAREIAPELAETPEIAWNRLAAEMKANIRLGLAAGECVRSEAAGSGSAVLPGFRPAVAVASLVALMATGVLLDRPRPHPMVAKQQGVVLQHTSDGIQVRDGSEAIGLMHVNVRDARDVTYTVGAQGSMRARYVDPDTGYVTINNVYAE